MDSEVYVKKFFEQGMIPMAHQGEEAVHDANFHSVFFLAYPPALIKRVQFQTSLPWQFDSWYQKHFMKTERDLPSYYKDWLSRLKNDFARMLEDFTTGPTYLLASAEDRIARRASAESYFRTFGNSFFNFYSNRLFFTTVLKPRLMEARDNLDLKEPDLRDFQSEIFDDLPWEELIKEFTANEDSGVLIQEIKGRIQIIRNAIMSYLKESLTP